MIRCMLGSMKTTFRKTMMILVLTLLGYGAMRLAFTAACRIGGHNASEAVWSAWTVTVLTAVIGIEAFLRTRN